MSRKRVIRKKIPKTLQKSKTRYWTRIQGDLTDAQMLRCRNSFVILKRNNRAERLVLMSRPTYQGRRHSVVAPVRVNETEAEIEAESQSRVLRNRSASVDKVPQNQAPLDENLNEFRLMLEAKIAQGTSIDEVDESLEVEGQEEVGGDIELEMEACEDFEGQVEAGEDTETYVGGGEDVELQVGARGDTADPENGENTEDRVAESQVPETPVEDPSQEIEIQHVELATSPTPDQASSGNDNEAVMSELNENDRLQYLEDDNFVSQDENAHSVDDIDQSIQIDEPLLVQDQQLAADNIDIDASNDSSSSQTNVLASVGLDENGNNVDENEKPVTEHDTLEVSKCVTDDSSYMEVVSSDSTAKPDHDAHHNVTNTAADEVVSSGNQASEVPSDNVTSDKSEDAPLDLSFSKEKTAVDLAVPMETDRSEVAQQDDNNIRQVQVEEPTEHQIQEQELADHDLAAMNPTQESCTETYDDLSQLDLSDIISNVSTPVPQLGVKAVVTIVTDLTVKKDPSSEGTSNELNETPSFVPVVGVPPESIMQMEIDRSEESQKGDDSIRRSNTRQSTDGQHETNEKSVDEDMEVGTGVTNESGDTNISSAQMDLGIPEAMPSSTATNEPVTVEIGTTQLHSRPNSMGIPKLETTEAMERTNMSNPLEEPASSADKTSNDVNGAGLTVPTEVTPVEPTTPMEIDLGHIDTTHREEDTHQGQADDMHHDGDDSTANLQSVNAPKGVLATIATVLSAYNTTMAHPTEACDPVSHIKKETQISH